MPAEAAIQERGGACGPAWIPAPRLRGDQLRGNDVPLRARKASIERFCRSPVPAQLRLAGLRAGA